MKMYAITHVGSNGRVLTFANQGRNHYQTAQQARAALNAFLENSTDNLRQVLGEAISTLQVRPVDCYEHGDAKGIYFDEDMQPVTGPPFQVVCEGCGKRTQTDREQIFANLKGEPYKAYYCAPCAGVSEVSGTGVQS